MLKFIKLRYKVTGSSHKIVLKHYCILFDQQTNGTCVKVKQAVAKSRHILFRYSHHPVF